MATDAIALHGALKKEIEANQPQIWQARASVELVHDLNNPLTVVIGYSALIVEEAQKLADQNPDLGKRMADYSVIVGKAAEYCHHLSENWRMASKKTAEFTHLDVVAVAFEVKQVIFFGSPAVQIVGPAGSLDQGLEVRTHAGLPEPAQELHRGGRDAGHHRILAQEREGHR